MIKYCILSCYLTCVLTVTAWSQSQSNFRLRLGFNAESNRFEVYATPTFTATKYTWGPSQITVVVPKQVADASISPRSSQAGVWLDQSMVYSPSTTPESDYHGFVTQGGKVDLVAGEEQLLFDFTLPQGYVDGVRLFDSAKDPSSRALGMNGGDFRSYVSDHTGSRSLSFDAKAAQLIVQATQSEPTTDEFSVQVVAYPNPSLNKEIRLYLKGFDENETVRVQLFGLTGKLVNQFDEKAGKLVGRSISLSQIADPSLVLGIQRLDHGNKTFTQKILLTN